MPPAGFEPAVPACECSQTHALERAATGTGARLKLTSLNNKFRIYTLIMALLLYLEVVLCYAMLRYVIF
jgi:hypothetical protein